MIYMSKPLLDQAQGGTAMSHDWLGVRGGSVEEAWEEITPRSQAPSDRFVA